MGPARLALAALLLSLLSACSGGEESPSGDAVPASWEAHALPAHPGAPGRSVVRHAVHCGGRWWVAGAVFLDRPTETQDTRPAAWTSTDARAWTPVPVRTRTYWGRRAILNSIACSRGRIAVVGARSGGAHGNPRVATFRLAGDTLVDVPALFTQYGGVSATNVGPIAGGRSGWLIAGNRTSGPGVWVTDDPRGFTRVEGEPGLVGGDDESLAQAGGPDGSGWVLVGGGATPGRMLDREPRAWVSPDGLAWQPQPMPSTGESEDVQRVVESAGRLVAVGVRGDRFAAWTRVGGRWRSPALFGAIADDARAAPYVASLVSTADGVLATVSDGDRYHLLSSPDGVRWRPVEVPVSPTVAGDHALTVAAGPRTLLVVDDGSGGRVLVRR